KSPLVNGSAQITLSTLTVGSHSISASYSGDFSPSTSFPLTHNVLKGQVTLAFSVSPDVTSIPYVDPLSINAEIRVLSPPVAPVTGTLSFNIDGVITTKRLVDGIATMPELRLDLGRTGFPDTYSG